MNHSHSIPFLPRAKIEPKPYGKTAPRTSATIFLAHERNCSAVTHHHREFQQQKREASSRTNHPRRQNAAATTIFFHASAPCSSKCHERTRSAYVHCQPPRHLQRTITTANLHGSHRATLSNTTVTASSGTATRLRFVTATTPSGPATTKAAPAMFTINTDPLPVREPDSNHHQRCADLQLRSTPPL